MIALVVFTTFQSFAVFAAIIQGAWLFVVLGLVFLGTGFLFDRARRGISANLEGADVMNRLLTVGVVVAVQAALVAVGVAPQISARVTGETHTFRVEPVDPIDPFRGAYVTLGYPDLRHDRSSRRARAGLDGRRRERRRSTSPSPRRTATAWPTDYLRERPDSGPYLACDDSGWQIRCGIESWFLPQDEAAEMERVLARGRRRRGADRLPRQRRARRRPRRVTPGRPAPAAPGSPEHARER